MEAAGRRPHFGALLRQFRLDAGITQQELAERAKLSVEAISTLERGARTRPHRDTVVLLGRALELSPKREALLESAIGVAHPSRQRERSDALDASLLRIVHADPQATPRHNLPQQLTAFVGRQHEVDEIATLLREHQLVTVVGAGGVGKTRIAAQLGRELLDTSPDGVWLVDLAPLADQTLVASTMLSTLQLPSRTGGPLEAVVTYLKTRRLLLILDNCEHMIAAVRDVAASILRSCPYVRILGTSRQALDAPAERIYRLPSMAVPPDSRGCAQDALRYGGVILFVDRAHAANSSFALVDDNVRDVIEICRRLDGIPLAIELAAARVNVLAPRQIAERLDQRFRLLTVGNAQGLPRHQTMTALIDWSYDLLTAREQRFFESLSVFAGGCTLDAATAVCASEDEDDIAVIDLVASLVGKSLLLAELIGNEQRYRLLESSREYAQGKLIVHGELEKVARRHAVFFVELAERLNDSWETIPDQEWLPQVSVELENWRATMVWALTRRGDVVLGQRMAGAHHVIGRSLTLMEARRWVGAALKMLNENTPSTLAARLELADATIAARLAQHTECLAAAERALARYQQNGDLVGIAQAQTLVGGSLVIFERFAEAEPLLRDALEAARKFGHRRLAVAALRMIALARTLVGDYTSARASYTEALRLANAVGAEHLAASVAASLSGNEYDAGDFETALRLMTDAMGTYRRLGVSAIANLASCVGDIAKYLIALGRYDEARAHAREALELARGVRYPVMVAILLQQLAVLELLRTPIESRSTSETFTAAAHIFGFVDECLAKHGIPKKYGLEEYDGALELLRSGTGEQELTRLMVAGAMMTEDEAIAQAHALE